MTQELLDFAEWLLGEYDVAYTEDDYEHAPRLVDARKTSERLVVEYMLSKEKK